MKFEEFKTKIKETFNKAKVKTKEVVNKAVDKPFKTALLIGVTGSAIAKIVKAVKGKES